MAVRGIQYTQKKSGKIKDYQSVTIRHYNGKELVFNTGDFVKDWFNALKFVLTGGLGEYPTLSDSSTVNHFIMDGAKFDSMYLHFVDDVPVLRKEYDYENPGYELFVEKGTTPTWEELKEICK